MRKSLKQRWIDALRSGKYKQGRLMLRDPHTGEFCCLGVLAKLRRVPNRELDENTSIPSFCIKAVEGASEFVAFPTTYCEVLAKMNDGGMSFKRIAKWIEKNL